MTLKSPYGDKKVTPPSLNFRFWIEDFRFAFVAGAKITLPVTLARTTERHSRECGNSPREIAARGIFKSLDRGDYFTG